LEEIFVHFRWRVIHVSLSDGARSRREWRVDSERYVVTSLSGVKRWKKWKKGGSSSHFLIW
jgi:hypothetical protein